MRLRDKVAIVTGAATGCRAIATQFAHEGGAIAIDYVGDSLINNAGVEHEYSFLETPRAKWDNVLAINLTGPFLHIQQAKAQSHQFLDTL